MAKKNKRFNTIVPVIVILILALLAGRHFSSRRTGLRIVQPVVPVLSAEEPGREHMAMPADAPGPEPSVPPETAEMPGPSVEDEQEESSVSHPAWFTKMLSVHKSYYPSWQGGRHTSATAPSGADRVSSAVASAVPAVSGGVPGPAGQASTGRTPVTHTSRDTATSRRQTGETVSSAGDSRAAGRIIPPGDDDGNGGRDTPPHAGEQPLTVERTISLSGDTAYVALKMNLHSDISGLIIIENIPEGYKITSASPNYSKQTGNTYRWLMYGRSVQPTTITYQVTGTQGGSITGSYRSTRGSGAIGGASAL